MRELMRRWTDPDGHGFVVRLYDTGRCKDGRPDVDFEFYHNGELVFQDTISVPVFQSVDGDGTLAAVISFCSLRPGDTDSEYFATYTYRQMEWCQEFGETLALYGDEHFASIQDGDAAQEEEFNPRWEDEVP